MSKFTATLWSEIESIYGAILEHPFLKGLTSGDLDEAAFRHYVVQDAIYLRSFARGLAILGAKADDDDQMMMFCEHATNAIIVERALHRGFLESWDLSLEAVNGAEPAPNCLLYTSYLLRVIYSRPYFEGLAAVLPCYWIYREVGRALQGKGSPNPLYQQWVDTYGGEEFGVIVDEILQVVDTIAVSLTNAQKEQMSRHFVRTSRMEYKFWDMGYIRQQWGV